jgi:hypothetical protein
MNPRTEIGWTDPWSFPERLNSRPKQTHAASAITKRSKSIGHEHLCELCEASAIFSIKSFHNSDDLRLNCAKQRRRLSGRLSTPQQ